ncbi:MAG TPA: MBL fold metallo-hydrolase [Actinomycetota bacterium]|jgi:L-ascorbate metabolism protein UlaG (beta-lactamase superfamily)
MTTPLEALRTVPDREDRAALVWLGQAGFAIRAGGATLLVDPFLSPYPKRRYETGLPPAAATGVDAVLCTHEHIDHFDAGSVPAIAEASPGAAFVVPSPIVDMVTEAGVAPDRVVGMQPGEPVELGPVTVHAVPARHGVTMADAYGFGEELSGGRIRFLGYVIDAGGVRIYHAGDTIHYEGMEAGLRPFDLDVALLPVNGRHAEREARGIVGNLNEREAAWLAAEIGARTLVPMHHDLFVGNLGSSAAVVHAAEEEERAVAVLVAHREVPFAVAGRGDR